MTTREARVDLSQKIPALAFSEASAQLIHALRSFAAALIQSRVVGKAQDLLPRVLQMAERFQLKRAAIADRCQVSEPTVSRWASARVKPHAIIAKVAIEAVRDLAVQKAREYEQELESQELESQSTIELR